VSLLERLEAEQPEPPVSRFRGRRVWRRLRRERAAVAALALIGLLALIALAAPLLTGIEGQDPTTFHSNLLDSARGGIPRGSFGGVSGRHWLGVEPTTGRDIFARVVYGARISLGIALAATLLQIVLATVIGLAAGLGGPWIDGALGRLIDLSIAVPDLLLGLALMAIVPDSVPRPLILIAVIAVTVWGSTARVVRAQVLSLKTRDYVAAATLGGAGPLRIAVREILPGLTTPLLVMAAFKVPTNMTVEAGLSFLGVGVRPPTPSWGQMLSTAATWFRTDPTYVLVPAAFLVLTLLAFVVFAEGVRTALDPRQARQRRRA
jgi:peptide/nickel transport system permease protein